MVWAYFFMGLLCSVLPPSAKPQYSVGAGVGMNIEAHTANFRTVSPTIPNCCPGFEGATGTGWGVSVTYDGFPLASRLRLLLEASYHRQSVTFLQQERTVVTTLTGESAPGTFEHELSITRSTLETQVLFGYTPIATLPQWQFRFGLQTGWVLGFSFSQRERLVEPAYGYFSDTGTRTRNERSGNIPNGAPVSFAIGLGMRYLLPIVARQYIALQPSVMGWIGLTRLASGVPWRAHRIAFTLSLVYAPLEMPSPLQPGKSP